MQTCSFVVQTITPDEADDDAITLRATTWGGSVIEFTDGDSIDRSDIGQALELAYLAGVKDAGGDVDAARDRFRAAQRHTEPRPGRAAALRGFADDLAADADPPLAEMFR